ncbi:MAG: hypothetical protein GY851_29090 [bacterium]|nr:hypothetical protein [bacterium]
MTVREISRSRDGKRAQIAVMEHGTSSTHHVKVLGTDDQGRTVYQWRRGVKFCAEAG